MDGFAALPKCHYRAILADPAWHYNVFSSKGEARSASKHYATMSMDEIRALPVGSLAASDCHLFMWCTGPNIARGDHVGVMEAWGFKPSAMAFVWIKSKVGIARQGLLHGWVDETCFGMGMGHTTRQNAEFILLGRRGAPKRLDRGVHQIIVAPRREHSRKPDEAYGRIERYCDGPYLELFARTRRQGWDSWGNEVDKFENAANA